MSSNPGPLNTAELLRSTAIFRELSDGQINAVWSQAKIVSLLRGEVLVRQNAQSDTVYVVVSGRFEVWVEGHADAINEIGVGEPIGEIGFFSGAPRNATIIAARDSVVLELDRPSFERVARDVPAIYQTLLAALARRAANTGIRSTSRRQVGVARTIVMVAGGKEPIPPAFYERLAKIVGQGGLVVDHAYVKGLFPGQAPDDPAVSTWLNTIENEYELIAYVADGTLTDWTRKAIRQADQVLILVQGEAPGGINPVEEFAFATHPAARRRLVRLHARRTGSVDGTAAWLADRDVTMHHHVALADDRDIKSLHRFLTGRAVGYVAAGGGGFGPAHIGIFKAFLERGVTFDTCS
jgi:NTE family protein